MLYQGNYFVVSVKLRQTHCIDDQDKVQFVTDIDNEFTECQTARKKLQLFGELLIAMFQKDIKYKLTV